MLCILVGCALLAGCGREEPPAEAEASAEPTATETPDAREQAKKEIRELTFDWLAAGAKGDGAALCETLAPSERRYYASRHRSCAAAWRKPTAFGVRTLKESRPGTIIVYEEGYATIEIHHIEDGNYMTIYAIDEGGRWGIARKKATGL